MYSKMISSSFKHFDQLYFPYEKSIIDRVAIKQILKLQTWWWKKSFFYKKRMQIKQTSTEKANYVERAGSVKMY